MRICSLMKVKFDYVCLQSYQIIWEEYNATHDVVASDILWHTNEVKFNIIQQHRYLRSHAYPPLLNKVKGLDNNNIINNVL